MPTISLIFATIAAIFHVLFFLMESVFWMNPKVHKTFGMKNTDEELKGWIAKRIRENEKELQKLP